MVVDDASGLRIDDEGLHVPAAWSGTLDVSFDGVRVYSINPQRHAVRADRRRLIRWPPQLRRYLSGRTRLSVGDHSSGTALAEVDVAFDDADSRVTVVDEEGHRLAADKWGRLSRTFDSLGREYGHRLLDDVEALLADVSDAIGTPAFIAYGTLLGAVREGDFIGHDTDADIGYLSRRTHPADIAAEAFDLQRGLVDRGWRTHRSTTTFLQVWRDTDAGEPNRIDVFTAYYVSDVFALDCWVRGDLPRESMLPLGTVELAGRRLPAPARPEDLLALTYGPQWRTPDPSFRFAVPRSTSRRAYGYFNRPFVFDAITVDPSLRPPEPGQPLRPSEFARWVLAESAPQAPIVDLRAGIGHDATWLAESGRTVLGLDVKDNSRAHRTDRPELADRLGFERLPIHELRRALARAAALAAEPGRCTLAVHRTLETLRPSGRINAWLFVRVLLSGGGSLFLEIADDRLVPAARAAVAGAGGVIVHEEEVPDGGSGPAIRIRAEWPTR